MNPPNIVRFFAAKDYNQITQFIDRFTQRWQEWEIISVSHTIDLNNMFSVACVLKFKGIIRSNNEKINFPEQDGENVK